MDIRFSWKCSINHPPLPFPYKIQYQVARKTPHREGFVHYHFIGGKGHAKLISMGQVLTGRIWASVTTFWAMKLGVRHKDSWEHSQNTFNIIVKSWEKDQQKILNVHFVESEAARRLRHWWEDEPHTHTHARTHTHTYTHRIRSIEAVFQMYNLCIWWRPGFSSLCTLSKAERTWALELSRP